MSKALALSAVLLLCLGAAFVEAAQEGRATELNKAGDNCTLPGGTCACSFRARRRCRVALGAD